MILIVLTLLVVFAIWPIVLVYNLLTGGAHTVDTNTVIAAVIIVPLWVLTARWAWLRYRPNRP